MLPGFLMATLNPGKTRKRRRRSRRNPFLTEHLMKTAFQSNRTRRRKPRRRRKLSAWQKAVKKFGGVMQAVRAMRGGAKRHRRRLKRRSAVSRASARGRSRRALRRRPKMARVRHRRRRRTPPRGRGGRFMSRRPRRRRHRRNPVVPVSFNPGRRRRRRSRSRRRNPLFLSRRGFAARKHRGYRRLRMRRRHPRHWHNNPVVPVSFNPRRRRRVHHRRRRHYRRNSPVLPFFAFNPGGGGGNPIEAALARVKSLVDVRFWTETGVPAAVGFFGSKALGGLIHQYTLTQFAGIGPTSVYYPFTKALADTVAGAALAWGAGRFYNKKAGDAIWLGTVVNVAYSLLKSLFGNTSIGQMIGLSGLGNDVSDRMKEAVVRRVQASLGSYLTTDALRTNMVRGNMGSYLTKRDLAQNTYDPSPRGNLMDYDVTSTETAL